MIVTNLIALLVNWSCIWLRFFGMAYICIPVSPLVLCSGIPEDLMSNLFLFQSNLKVLLPRVIRYADKPSSIILRIIAKQLDINRREMLFFNFKFIFSFLVRNCIGSELEKTLKYLQVKYAVLSKLLPVNSFSLMRLKLML